MFENRSSAFIFL